MTHKVFFILTVAILSVSVAVAQQSLKIGSPLPAAAEAMQNASGAATTLAGAMGKNGLLVMFSCNTCPFVVRNQATTKQTMDYAARHGIGMVIVNANEAKRDDDDSYDAMKKYAAAQHYTVPYVVDKQSRLADMFGASHTPEIFLFNNKGVLVYKGAMNDNPGNPSEAKTNFINSAIDALISGAEIKPDETKSIGCSIKRRS